MFFSRNHLPPFSLLELSSLTVSLTSTVWLLVSSPPTVLTRDILTVRSNRASSPPPLRQREMAQSLLRWKSGSVLAQPISLLSSHFSIHVLSVFYFLLIFIFIYLAASSLRCVTQDLVVVLHGLSRCGVWAYLPPSMWDLSSPTKNQARVPLIVRWIPKPLDH